MTRRKVYEIIENELRCVQTASTNCCDRDCGKCSIVMDSDEIIKAYGIVLMMLDDIDKLKAEVYKACMDDHFMPTKLLSCDEITEIIDNITEEYQ